MQEQNKSRPLVWHVVVLIGAMVAASGVTPRMYWLWVAGRQVSVGDLIITLGLAIIFFGTAVSAKMTG